MDVCRGLEIYIPVEAEVKSVPLHSLHKSLLRSIGVSASDRQGLKVVADSHQCVWICPADIRMTFAQTLNCIQENMASLLAASCHNPMEMPFVSANHTAYKILKKTLPGAKVSHKQQPIPDGLPLWTQQAAIIVHQSRVFLSIKKSAKKGETDDRHSSPPSTSAQSHVINTQELQGTGTSICKNTVNEHEDDVYDKGGHVLTSTGGASVPQPPDNTHTLDLQPPPDQDHHQDHHQDYHLVYHQVHHLDHLQDQNLVHQQDHHLDHQQDQNLDHSADHPTQNQDTTHRYLDFSSYDQRWSREYDSTFLSQEVDFQALEQDEIIARKEARLRQCEAALYSLHPTL